MEVKINESQRHLKMRKKYRRALYATKMSSSSRSETSIMRLPDSCVKLTAIARERHAVHLIQRPLSPVARISLACTNSRPARLYGIIDAPFGCTSASMSRGWRRSSVPSKLKETVDPLRNFGRGGDGSTLLPLASSNSVVELVRRGARAWLSCGT